METEEASTSIIPYPREGSRLAWLFPLDPQALSPKFGQNSPFALTRRLLSRRHRSSVDTSGPVGSAPMDDPVACREFGEE